MNKRLLQHCSCEKGSQVRCYLIPAIFSATLLTCIPAMGAEWTVTPSLIVREVYTDNVTLAPPGEEKSDFVTTINPAIWARGRGRRLEVDLVYSPQAVIRARDTTSINHRLQADATAELVEQRFFLDLRSTVAQTNQTDTGPRAFDDIPITPNQIDTVTYSVSPYVRQRFGDFADALVRYTYDEVLNQGNAVDSRSNKINAEINSGSDFNRLRWNTAYYRQHIEYRDGGDQQDDDFEAIDGTLRYLFNRKYSVFVSGGVENNNFQSIEDTDGPFWRAGATWTPSPRTFFEASYGERFFGEFWAASMRHRSRRTIWAASFNTDTTTTQEIQLQRVLVQFVDPFGNPIVDPVTGAQITIPIDTPTLSDEVIVRERFQASVALQGRRNTVTLSGFHEVRDFQASGNQETLRGANAVLRHGLSSRTNLNVSGGWEVTDFQDEVREDTLWYAAVSLRHQIGPSLDGLVEIRRTEDDSNIDTNDYIENRLTLQLSMTFDAL